jgi:translation initiation factor IF-2
MTVEELRLQKEKVRVFELARELDMESKDLMALCRQQGIELKNQLSTVGPEQRDQIIELVKRGPAIAAAQQRPATPVIPSPISRKVQTLDSRPRPGKPGTAAPAPTVALQDTPISEKRAEDQLPATVAAPTVPEGSPPVEQPAARAAKTTTAPALARPAEGPTAPAKAPEVQGVAAAGREGKPCTGSRRQ